MLALCRDRAEREGLAPNLYAQASHELDLPRSYRTIYVCGSFGIGGNAEHDRIALRRVYEHLEPGGVLILDQEMPYADTDGWRSWSRWTKEGRRGMPEAFDDPGWRAGSDGTEYRLASRLVDVDPLAQRQTMEMRASMRRGDEIVEEQTLAIALTLYTARHIELLLTTTGFTDLELRDGYSDAAASPDTDTVVFLARKPEASA